MAANVVISCGFASISEDFIRKSSLEKGRKLCDSGHVSNVTETIVRNSDADKENTSQNVPCVGLVLVPDQAQHRRIDAAVIPQTSIRKTPYQVKIHINSARQIIEAQCECKAGVGKRGKCKHVAAVFMYVNTEETESCTSGPQLWGRPSQSALEKYKKGHTMEEMFSSEAYTQSSTQVPDIELSNLILKSNINCSLRSILVAEMKQECERVSWDVLEHVLDKTVDTCECSNIDNIMPTIFHNHRNINFATYHVSSVNDLRMTISKLKETPLYRIGQHEIVFYNNQVCLDQSTIVAVCKSTRTQYLCKEWFSHRRIRISASKAHRIVTRKANFEELALSLISQKSFSNDATKYGIKMERQAKACFSNEYSAFIIEVGLVIAASKPWLCCSPDGIFKKNLTILCNYSKSNVPTLVQKK